MQALLAYFYWDPDRVMLFVPYIERPIMWYGLLFVTGFIIGYFLMIPIFQKKLTQTTALMPRDICCWESLLRQLRRADQQDVGEPTEVVKSFSPSLLLKLKNQSLPAQLKKEILEALNQFTFEREKWHALFPKAFYRLRELSTYLADKLLWFVLGGAVVGARLGHVFFYQWPYFSKHPGDILKVWEGGLASHGGTIGIILGVAIYLRLMRNSFPELGFINLVDMLCIPIGLAAFFIRMGNFVNQELFGLPTTFSWAVIFGHPADGSAPVPRHPAQIYEGIAYLATFALIYTLWRKKGEGLRQGFLSGTFFICTFGARFVVEFVKTPLSNTFNESFLQAGQLLSIPFILLGVYLLFFGQRKTTARSPKLQPTPQDR